MNRFIFVVLLPMAGRATGSYEDQQAFRNNFMQGLSNMQQARPTYQQAPPRITNTDCIRTFNGGMSCTSN